MKTRKAHQEFCEEVRELTNNTFGVLSEYKTKDKKVEFIHYECGNIFEDRPSNFLQTLKCRSCGKSVNLEDIFRVQNHQEFLNYVAAHSGDIFEVTGQYINMDTRVKVKCLRCEKEWMVLPRTWLRTFFCYSCDGGEESGTEGFILKMYKRYGAEYVLCGEYINNKLPVTILHTGCGKKMKVLPSTVVGSSYEKIKCKHCYKGDIYPDEQQPVKKGRVKKKKRLTNRTYQTQVNKLTENRFELVSDYKGTDNLVTIKDSVCRKTFEITAKAFLSNPYCRCCEFTLSAPVRKIIDYMTQQGYRCEPEYIIEDCKNKRPLRYDLGIFKDDKFIGCIEFDGIHHYVPIYGVDQFKYVRKIDTIKNEYCSEFGVYLLRIPFWEEENIWKILKKEIHKGNMCA